MKIKERYIVYISVALILIASGYWIWYDNKTVDFHIDEFFADSSYNGKINFNFVSVDKYDEQQMFDFAKQISTENLTLDMLRRDLPLITVVHFYKISDTTELDEKMIRQIQKQYPHIKDVKASLQSVPGAYIYTGFSKYIHNLRLPQDTIFQSTVIIPKKGIKAKDILKVNKAKNNSDSLKVNNENLRKK